MPQLTLYVDETTARKIRACAAASGVSLSRWVADLVQARTAAQWPHGGRGVGGLLGRCA